MSLSWRPSPCTELSSALSIMTPPTLTTNLAGLLVINNESGWYEGWMIHDLVVPPVAAPRSDGSGAQFGTMTAADAYAIKKLGTGNNVTGNLFTTDGQAAHLPCAKDHFPDKQTNVVPIFLSMGAYNSLQQSDAHAYWEFNQYTDWVFPLYELPFTGGCGLANEILLDAYVRVASFEPGVKDIKQRLFDAYAKEVARIDQNGDGILSPEEADLEDFSDGGQSNDRLFIPATRFNRFAVTREINDGLLAPRFAPSQRAWVLSGNLVLVSPTVPASILRDADDR
jgi:hypothetical protein